MTAQRYPCQLLVKKNFLQACPDWIVLRHNAQEKVPSIVFISHFQQDLLTHVAQAKYQYEPKASETLPRHITYRSLMMTEPRLIFALYVSVRLPEQTSTSSEIQPYQGSCLNLLHAGQIVEVYALVLGFFQRPKRLGLLVISVFLTFDRLVQLLVFVIHVFPFCSLDPLENGLTDGVSVLIHVRWSPICCLQHPWCQ